jgi:hypothetical protein
MDKKEDISELTTEDIFINLKLISKIDVGDKLTFKTTESEKYINIESSYIPSITRWLHNVDRKKCVNFVSNIVCQSFKIIDTTNDIQLILRFTSEYRNVINGLMNLKQTYSDDKLIQSEIDVLIENIRSKIEHNSSKLRLNESNHQSKK